MGKNQILSKGEIHCSTDIKLTFISKIYFISVFKPSLRTQTTLCGVVALCYQYHKVPQLHKTQAEPLY